MNFDDLISGPCALPHAPMAMPAQELERSAGLRRRLMGRLRLAPIQAAWSWVKADV